MPTDANGPWATDDGNHTVRQFTPTGKLLLTLGTLNTPSDTGYDGKDSINIPRAAGPFNRPTNLAVGPKGDLYISIMNIAADQQSAGIVVINTPMVSWIWVSVLLMGLGGIVGPVMFGHLVATGDRGMVAIGFGVAAVVMALGGLAELLFGVRAEQTPLEDIAKPLTADEIE